MHPDARVADVGVLTPNREIRSKEVVNDGDKVFSFLEGRCFCCSGFFSEWGVGGWDKILPEISQEFCMVFPSCTGEFLPELGL